MNDISTMVKLQTAAQQPKPAAPTKSGGHGVEPSPILNPSPAKDVVTLQRSEPVVKAIDAMVNEVMDALINHEVDLSALTHNLSKQSSKLVQ
ncbi:hypothetical protein Mmc1_0285 [Magnetococcus marinus MC-1]|uniref:Uncharacterized protein n=1 Tax=Magnetococcus marinus (strain ATCC BAA-1437 / JCM 17883 / MC-1) TaxID=156889 RepID=A0L4B9_MAGMM|nr:hypothetical protein [Magnetococcus marinus]ABK42812.1 hypothetical protein Mmc1_0285 [Magnetococcus marinus MC-1]